MAKKRTVLPFYGKANQWLDQAATRLAKSGNIDGAKELADKSRDIRRKRMERAGVIG